MQGWIALHRELLEKPIWRSSTPEQKAILITLLLMANHEQNEWEWKGQKFKARPGQFVTSLESIRRKAGKGISTKNIRSALERFKKLEFLADEGAKTGRLITIVNWEQYQEVNKKVAKQPAKRWQRGGKEVATNNNDNNDNNETSNNNIPYVEIINFLNQKCGKNYKHTTRATREKIQARWNEGFRLEDFKAAITKKAAQWKKTEMDSYLRPETLFGPKFESYLNERQVKTEGGYKPKEILS